MTTALSADAPSVVSIVIGPDDHGVVHHALATAAAAGIPVLRRTSPTAAIGRDALSADVDVAHLHFTDRLFGPDATTSARTFGRVVGGLRQRLVVTLHDIPEPDGTAYAVRRIDAYRGVAGHADLLVVCSDHERDRWQRCAIGGEVHVVPLPIEQPLDAVAPGPLDGAGRIVGVLGFVYPGKGHADVIDAVALLPDDVTVWSLGRASDGHDDLVEALRVRAARRRRRFVVTGYLDDATMTSALRRVDVPVVPARSTSASSSIGTWIGAGRRPLAAANGYTRELAASCADLVTLYEPSPITDLSTALGAALAAPASTWHGAVVADRYTPAGVAEAHHRLYQLARGRP